MNLQILCLWLIPIGAKLNLIIVSVNLHKSEEACDIYYVTKSFFCVVVTRSVYAHFRSMK